MNDLLGPEDLSPEEQPVEGDGWVDLPLGRQADEPEIVRPRIPPSAEFPEIQKRHGSSGLGWWILLLVLALPVGIYAGYRWNLAPPMVVASQPWLDFGEIKVGESAAEQRLELANGGEQPLQLTTPSLVGEHADDFKVVENSCAIELAPQDRCSVRLVAKPSANGLRKASLRLDSNAANGPLTVALIVAGSLPRLTVEPMLVDFGQLVIGTSSDLATVRLKNSGNAVLDLAAIDYDGLGRGSGDFVRQDDDCSQRQLQPGESCSLSFLFVPTEAGERTVTLRIASDQPDAAPVPRLVGRALAPKPRLELAQRDIDFGLWPVGEETPAQSVTLRNGGTVPLRIEEVVAAADSAFRVDATACLSRPLPPTGECRVEVRFTPQKTSESIEDLQIRHDGVGGLDVISLTGAGSSPDFAVQPLRLAFGETPLGEISQARQVRFTNPGNAVLVISQVSVDGGDASAFSSQAGSCVDERLAPGESCAIEVCFKPRRSGPQRAELVIRHNARGGVQRLAINGIGVRARLVIDPSQIDFGQVAVGALARREILLSNTGRAPVTVRRIRLQGSQINTFNLDTKACLGRELTPGSSCRVVVSFQPDEAGSRDVQVLIESSLDDGDGEVRLLAIGVESATPNIARPEGL